MTDLSQWVFANPTEIVGVLISTSLAYMCLVTLTRICGVRSFSKMSGFDFAVTVAIGSIFASIIISPEPSLARGLSALALIFFVQIAVAYLRVNVPFIRSTLDNSPVVIMIGPDIQEDLLAKVKMTKADLFAKLREANVINLSEVKVVIAETTGDVSVLHGTDDTEISVDLLKGAIGAERVPVGDV